MDSETAIPPPDPRHRTALVALTAIFWTAVAVSIVHYADNYFNYESFPQSETLPNPSALTVLLAWFALTAFGLAGYELFRRRRYPIACICLGVYSGSGLVGIAHYAVPGMTDAVWWRQAHVVADIFLGAAVFAFALWGARRMPVYSLAESRQPMP
ncbi:MAG: hypothetical protein H0V25_06625 [Solirubrobacterales bacterium]|nr:hypothetical protein [Solirubrobacterales bacterium]